MKKFISIFLVGILSLPSVFGLNHVLFDDHSECFEQNVHFHESEVHCSTCDFIRLNVDFDYDEYSYIINEPLNNYKHTSVYNKNYFSKFYFHFDSRGPPVDC